MFNNSFWKTDTKNEAKMYYFEQYQKIFEKKEKTSSIKLTTCFLHNLWNVTHDECLMFVELNLHGLVHFFPYKFESSIVDVYLSSNSSLTKIYILNKWKEICDTIRKKKKTNSANELAKILSTDDQKHWKREIDHSKWMNMKIKHIQQNTLSK